MSIYNDLDNQLKRRQVSYMMVTILAMLKSCTPDGITNIGDIVNFFRGFYQTRQQLGKLPEKEKFLMAKVSSLTDAQIKELILTNPVQALSNFVSYRGDHEQLRFTDRFSYPITEANKEQLRNLVYKHLYEYYKEFDPRQLTLSELSQLSPGVAVTATDVSLLSGQNQMKGIHPINKDGFKAVLILCTIGGESYPNEWLDEQKNTLKYYLEGRTDKETQVKTYNENIPSNKAIIDSREEGYPIYVFTRDKKSELFHFAGEFLFETIKREKTGDTYFRLNRKEVKKMGIPDVSREKIIQVMGDFDKDKRHTPEWKGWDKKINQKYAISYEAKLYPPKQIISMATGLALSEFSGGDQSNSYLQNRRFEIIALHNEMLNDGGYQTPIQMIYEYIADKGFSYELSQIQNFYLCMKTKPFIILAGISGTGKSKLVELFAEAVGANSSNGRYEMIPVRPDWNDSSDLLGYHDINGKFKPGPLTRVLQLASKDMDKPFFVCLDEMNLSRVEYYFSDLLSLMETKQKINDRYFSKKIFHDDFFQNEEDKKEFADLRLPPNVIIIGTVNMDETTFPISKKVLDRANTIEFSIVNLKSLPNGVSAESETIKLSTDFFEANYYVLKDCREYFPYLQDVVERLDSINTVLAKANLQIGYRVRDEICFYMLYNKRFSLLEETDAFDFQLIQKMLPKIQGSSSQVFDVLVKLLNIATGQNFTSDDTNLGEQAIKYVQENKVKPYPRSAEKIATMLWRFEDGFTSFWL